MTNRDAAKRLLAQGIDPTHPERMVAEGLRRLEKTTTEAEGALELARRITAKAMQIANTSIERLRAASDRPEPV